QLARDPHAHVPVDHFGPALGVEADEIERGAGTARGVVLPANAMLEKGSQELPGFLVPGTGGMRSADARRWQRALHRVDGVVIELVVLLGRAFPITDVRLVPDFPKPGLDLI